MSKLSSDDQSKQGCVLDALDTKGPPPTKLVLAGPDHVIVSEGKDLAITAPENGGLRFILADSTLTIQRVESTFRACIIHVTMPVPSLLLVAGSGTLEAAQAADAELSVAGSGTLKVAVLTGDAKLAISGSGRLNVARVTDVPKLAATVSGSGCIEVVSGQAGALTLAINGSGRANLRGLSVTSAEATIAGSGSAEFSSDGVVDARVRGSGTITVNGHATCRVQKMGSGTVHCRDGIILAD